MGTGSNRFVGHGRMPLSGMVALSVALVGGSACALLLGCAAEQAATIKPAPKPKKKKSVKFRLIPSGVVETKGVTISADDGSFRFTGPSAQAPPPLFRTPFTVECRVLGQPTVGGWKKALDWSAQRVSVIFPGRTRPLHGILALCGAHPDDGSAAARSYRISVPKSRVDQTSGGRVSFVFELGAAMLGGTHVTWILWLSETPFPFAVGAAGSCERYARCCRDVGSAAFEVNKKNGKAPKGAVGVSWNTRLMQSLKIQQVFPGLPAYKAGLRDGDTLLTIDGKAFFDVNAVVAVLRNSAPGTVLKFVVDRAGKRVALDVKVGAPELLTVAYCKTVEAKYTEWKAAGKLGPHERRCKQTLDVYETWLPKNGSAMPQSCK